MNCVGRKPKDSKKQQEQETTILEHLRVGATHKDAALAVGVDAQER